MKGKKKKNRKEKGKKKKLVLFIFSGFNLIINSKFPRKLDIYKCLALLIFHYFPMLSDTWLSEISYDADTVCRSPEP